MEKKNLIVFIVISIIYLTLMAAMFGGFKYEVSQIKHKYEILKNE